MNNKLIGFCIIFGMILLGSANLISFNYSKELGYETDQYLKITNDDFLKIKQIDKVIIEDYKRKYIEEYYDYKYDSGDFYEQKRVVKLIEVIGQTEIFKRHKKKYLKYEFEVQTDKTNGFELIYLVVNFNNYDEYYVVEDLSDI